MEKDGENVIGVLPEGDKDLLGYRTVGFLVDLLKMDWATEIMLYGRKGVGKKWRSCDHEISPEGVTTCWFIEPWDV